MNLEIAFPALRYAAAVNRLGSFSAAARACGVSQPTVSSAIASLEEALGARLFERTTRKVALTPAGGRLLPMVEEVTSAVADLEREATALRTPERKLLRIGFSQLVGAQRLGLLFEPFVRHNPDVEIVYKQCSQGDMEDRLDANTVDVVCGTGLGRARNRARQVLYKDALHWVPPSGVDVGAHATLPEAARRRLVLTNDSCGLAAATRQLFAHARIRIDEYAGYAMSYAALEEWAELGIGGAVLPASHIRKAGSAPLHRDKTALALTYEAVWRKDLLVSLHAKAFVAYLRSVVPGLARGGAGSGGRPIAIDRASR
jgi:DNA-binding transcriptional LysR family regulator